MKLEKVENGYRVLTDTNKQIGYFILDIDGSYYLRFEELAGYWNAHSLREIATLLDEVNKPFDDEVREYFDKEKEKQNNCYHNMVQDSDWNGHIENNQTCSKCGYTNY